jgi:hypothetical protein
MSEPMWEESATKEGMVKAVLRAGKEVICTVYLSPDYGILRIMLPEFHDNSQLKIEPSRCYLDFKRKL